MEPALALATAEAALVADHEEAALDAVLDAWRETRAGELAALVHALDKRLTRYVAPIEGKASELHEIWLAMARQQRAVHYSRLWRSVLLAARGRSGVAVVEQLIERGRVLVKRPADPRTVTRLVELMKCPTYAATSVATHPFWRDVLRLVAEHGDARDAPAIDAIDPYRALDFTMTTRQFFVDQLGRTVRALERKPAPPRLTGELSAIASRLTTAVAGRGVVRKPERDRLAEPVAVPVARRARVTKPRGPIERDPSALSEALAQAARCMSEHQDRAALPHLLDAWRMTRVPAIAELVEAVSARIESTLPPITSPSRRQLHEQWLALAAAQDPADLPRLIDAITDTKHRSTDALARVRALARWPADPRTGPGVLRQLQRPAFYTTSTKPFWSALLALAVEHGDPRTAAGLAQLSAEFHRILVTRYADATPTVKWFRKLFDQTLAELAAQPPPLPLADDDAAACARIRERLRARPGTERELFAEVQASPDDDHLRHVLADQLQERGDPRGEFIALQLADRDPERQRALLAQFRHRWLGPLAHAVRRDTCRFERGFLHEVYLVEDKPELLARLVGDPIWATVRRLHLVYPVQPPIELLRHPIMRLDHLGGFDFYPDGERVAVLGWPEVPYRSLHLSTGVHDDQYTAVIAYLATGNMRDKLHRLRSLTLTDPFVEPEDALAQLRTTWLGDQLDELGFAGGLARLPQWLSALRRRPLAIRTFTLSSFGEQIGTLVLSRDRDGAFSRATFTVEHVTDPRARDWVLAYSDIVEALEHVPPTRLQAIEVRGRRPRSTERAELERVCKRIGAALALPA